MEYFHRTRPKQASIRAGDRRHSNSAWGKGRHETTRHITPQLVGVERDQTRIQNLLAVRLESTDCSEQFDGKTGLVQAMCEGAGEGKRVWAKPGVNLAALVCKP